jgi:magnesium transporter
LLSRKNDRALRQFLLHEPFNHLSSIIDNLANGRRKIFSFLPPEKQAEVALVISEDSKKNIFHRLSEDTVARFLHFLEEDEATDILQYLHPRQRTDVLQRMKPKKRENIEKLLTFSAETAGGLMDLNFLDVPLVASLKSVLEQIRMHTEGRREMPTVLVLSEQKKVVGFIPERTLLFPPQKSTLDEHVISIPCISHRMDREEVMQIMSNMRSELLCVVDDSEYPLGIIHLRDLISVAEAEATEDLYRFAGVDIEEHALDPVAYKVRRRSRWLLFNLLTAFLAAFVVSLFTDTIARFAILAVYMPIVAGQGGNAATQALAVVVRGLALGDIGWPKAKRVILRESIAGMLNGVITGFVAGLTAVIFGATPVLGVILATSMIINLFVAGFFGALIPFILKRFNIDPAIASTVFVTTMTDVCGFFTFLGLGALFMG